MNYGSRRDALPASAIVRAIEHALEQPEDVDVNELVVQPTAQLVLAFPNPFMAMYI
ncbi:hypothetical protein GT019_04370 [Paenibacillus sp. T1]|uniref:Uncharacterized protein n=1 Tax=Paenibacillus glycinis TaxID=2697035 RepID=A0ABW9XKX0_9BACL|nr:hypothetical protein [Paenibacillus glycinis]